MLRRLAANISRAAPESITPTGKPRLADRPGDGDGHDAEAPAASLEGGEPGRLCGGGQDGTGEELRGAEDRSETPPASARWMLSHRQRVAAHTPPRSRGRETRPRG